MAIELIPLLDRIAGPLLGTAKSWWQRRRYGARLDIALSWDHAPIIVVGLRTPRWRVVKLAVTAPTNSEFVVASGLIEAKASRGPWNLVADLANELNLPLVVQANRRFEATIDGASLVKALKPLLGTGDTAFLRITVEDYHRRKLQSPRISCTLAELGRKDYM